MDRLPDSLREAAANNDVEAFFKELDTYAVCGFLPIVLEYLNELLTKNPQSVNDLCEFRVPMQMSKEDPFPIQVTKVDGKEGLHFGLIGIINGLIERLMGGDLLIAGAYDKQDRLRAFRALAIVRRKGHMASLVPMARKTQEIITWTAEQNRLAEAGISEEPPDTDDGMGHCSHCSNPITDAEQMDNSGLCNECAEKDAAGRP